jgi:hypothetical protein
MLDLNIPVEDKTVVALYFETDRAPFVVKVPQGGAVEREVPWREGTRVLSAKRAELLQILVPRTSNPEVEILDCLLRATGAGEETPRWFLEVLLYLVPRREERLVFPFHRCKQALSFRPATSA